MTSEWQDPVLAPAQTHTHMQRTITALEEVDLKAQQMGQMQMSGDGLACLTMLKPEQAMELNT